MNALNPEKVWVLTKCEDGFSAIRRASEYEFVKELSEEGVPLGDMWYSLHLEDKWCIIKNAKRMIKK